MYSEVLGWADVATDALEVAALVAVLLLLARLHRNIAAMLRVIRRMDRKTADAATSAYRRHSELNEAPVQLAGSRQPELDRPVAD
jgi:hypothetical protein